MSFKKVILFTLILQTTAYAADTVPAFRCTNIMYRSAVLEKNSDSVILQDSFPEGAAEITRAIEKTIGLKQNQLILHEVRLTMAQESLNCSAPFKYMLNCTGSSENAYLSLSGNIDYQIGIGSGSVDLSIPVQVKKLDLQSSLGSPGPHSISGQGTVIALNHIFVNATAEIMIKDQPVKLKWTPFFTTGPDHDGSSCQSL